METETNETLCVLSPVVLMVSAGHNSLQRTCTPAQMNARSYMCVHVMSTPPFFTPSLPGLCVRHSLYFNQCKEDIRTRSSATLTFGVSRLERGWGWGWSVLTVHRIDLSMNH